MSNIGDEIARYSKAERELCEAVAPLLAAMRAIETRAGLRIIEIRMTIDHAASLDGSITANCTIVRAQDTAGSAQSATRSGDSLASDPA